jgi:hypothetical protein
LGSTSEALPLLLGVDVAYRNGAKDELLFDVDLGEISAFSNYFLNLTLVLTDKLRSDVTD